MSSQSQLSVCNLALLAIGSKVQISNLTEGSTASNACNTLFSFVFENLAQSAWWNPLRKQESLTLLAAAPGTPENQNGATTPYPDSPWLYLYEYPSDCINIRTLVPPSNTTNNGTNLFPVNNNITSNIFPSGRVPFAVAYSTDSSGNPITTILTNLSQAQAIYTVNQQNPAVWDGSFTNAFVASLAAYLVPALSLNMQLMQGQIALAERYINDARTSDANEGYTSQDHTPDWMSARGVSYYTVYGNNMARAGGLYGLSNMSWPSAVT